MRMVFGSMLVAVAAVPVSAQVAAPPLQTVAPDATLLEVSATGKAVRTPDLATIRAGVVTQAPTAAAALRDNAGRMAQVVRALKGAGIADRDLSTSNVSLQPQYRYAENQPPAITGYQASNGVSVRFRDVGKAGPALDALVAAGANQIDGPTLSLSDPDAALDAARTDAVQRARARADLYAKAAGLRVERILSIGEAGENDGDRPQPPMAYRARMAVGDAAPATAVLAGETEVSASLTVRFVLR